MLGAGAGTSLRILNWEIRLFTGMSFRLMCSRISSSSWYGEGLLSVLLLPCCSCFQVSSWLRELPPQDEAGLDTVTALLRQMSVRCNIGAVLSVRIFR